jgi:hypothetical protein
MEGDGLIFNNETVIFGKTVEYFRSGGDDARFVAIASREVLRHDHGNLIVGVRHEKNFRVVVSEIAVFNRLLDEWPENESFIRGFEIEDDRERVDKPFLLDEEYSTEELLGD